MQWHKFGFGVQILSVGHCSCSGDYISNWTFPLNRKIWKRFHEKINYNIDSYLQVRCKVEGKLSHFNDQDMTGGCTEPGFAFRVIKSGLLHFKCETKDALEMYAWRVVGLVLVLHAYSQRKIQ